MRGRLEPREKRISALKIIIANQGVITLDEINQYAGYSDDRVLLLTLAECAEWGLVNIIDGSYFITKSGREWVNNPVILYKDAD